ncbi:MAG: M23 family metallopeptidase [bacterium]
MQKKFLVFLISALTTLSLSCSSNLSKGRYRIPYSNNTQIKVAQDHKTHDPEDRVDLIGVRGMPPYRIVAAAAGTVRFIEDRHTASCSIPEVTNCGACNNYVWIEHSNGEWTKYSHFQTGSVTKIARISVGQRVAAGTFLGVEGDVGSTRGSPGRAQVACDHNPIQQALIDSVNAVRRSMGLDSVRARVHLHFEVGVPDNLQDPINPAGGFLKGKNRVPQICGIAGSLFKKDSIYVAADCPTSGKTSNAR